MPKRRIVVAGALSTLALLVHAEAPAVSNTIVFSELRTRGPNGGNDEFIEIFNLSDSPVDVSGFRIRKSDGAGTTSLVATIPPGTVIPSRRFYLFVNLGSQGYSGTVAGDQAYTEGISDNGGVALFTAGDVLVDAVGMSATSAYKEGTPLPQMTFNVNQSFERKVAGCSPDQDSDDNFEDFNINGSSSRPQNSATRCNPCQGVICNKPPTPECYNPTGVCQQGSCVYSQRAPGTACSDGDACTAGDACNAAGMCVSGGPNPCDDPPDDFCSDSGTLVEYDPIGTCSSNSGCSYTSQTTPCAFGCNGTTGACNPNPCTGVSCTTPPNQCFEPAGTCSNGTCTYAFKPAASACTDGNACTEGDTCNGAGACVPGTPKPIDDGNVCTADSCNPANGVVTNAPVDNGTNCDDGNFCNGVSTCQAGACTPGAPVTCDTPPAGGCYEDTGTCNPVNGACSYPPLAAATTCNDGDACTTADACDGNGNCDGSTVVCTPPMPVCLGENTSRSFSNGTCNAANGMCTFTNVDTSCVAGCNTATGRCNADPCEGVVCDDPPSQCHSDVGTCAGGSCSYPLKPAGAACDDGNACTSSDGCTAAGQCTGEPLACNSPPIATCTDANTSRTFDATGTCDAGVCSYTPIDTSCVLGCDDDTGLCVDDPCFGTNCDEPPSQCHQAIGTCSAGVCTYELRAAGSQCDDGNACTSDDACSESGECSGDVVVCNSPPPAECTNASTSRVYDAAGQCDEAGDCVYMATDTQCETTCDDTSGLCEGDPCIGVVCNSPPGQCFLEQGTCSDGECEYGPAPADVACDDGDACTIGDVCDGTGECVGSPDPACGDAGVPDGGVPPDGSAGAGGAGPDGGAPDGAAGTFVDGGAGSGGTPGSGGREGDGGQANPNLNSVEGGGCNCTVPASPASPRPFVAAALLCLGLALRRRPRR